MVESGRWQEALDRLRELKLELLARMLLEEARPLPFGEVENAGPAVLPSDAANASPGRRPEPGSSSTDTAAPPEPEGASASEEGPRTQLTPTKST